MKAKQLIEAYSEALGKGDIPKAFSFFDTDAKWHQPGNHKFSGIKNNVDEIGAMLSNMMQATEGSLAVKPNGPLMVSENLVAACTVQRCERRPKYGYGRD